MITPQPDVLEIDVSRARRRVMDFVELGKPRVVVMVLVTTGVGFYLGVAPVVARCDYGFLADVRGRVALIAGARDEYSDPARLEALAGRLSPRPWLRVLTTDHFFADALDDLAAACGEAIAWAAEPSGR